MKNKSKNSFLNILTQSVPTKFTLTLFIGIFIVVTVVLANQPTHYLENAAMKMPMSPMPSDMPGNGNTVIVHIVHKGMSMGGNGSGMSNSNGGNIASMVEQSDSEVDSAMVANISPTMQMNGSKGNINMGGNNACGNMHDMFFTPKVVTIPVGTTVKWINDDPDMKHTTTSIRKRGAESWDSRDLKPGESFTQTFTHVGIYPYDCDIHPWMRGVVRVVDSISLSPIPSKMPTMSPMPSM